jgi:hypothetical protein
VASSDALDVLHQAMCPASYRRIRMVIKFASNLPAFSIEVILTFPTTTYNNHVMVNMNINQVVIEEFIMLTFYPNIMGTCQQ